MKSDSQRSQRILKRIKDQNVRPLSKWIFRIRTFFLIFMFVLSTAFGSLSVSLLWANLRFSLLQSQIRIGRGFGVFLVLVNLDDTEWIIFGHCLFSFSKITEGVSGPKSAIDWRFGLGLVPPRNGPFF